MRGGCLDDSLIDVRQWSPRYSYAPLNMLRSILIVSNFNDGHVIAACYMLYALRHKINWPTLYKESKLIIKR